MGECINTNFQFLVQRLTKNDPRISKRYERELERVAALSPEQLAREYKRNYFWVGGPDWSSVERELDL